jgi:hypothetical protein
MAAGPDDPIWGTSLLPTDRPRAEDVRVTLDEAVQLALKNRPELEQLRLQVQQNGLLSRYYAQETRPTVNLLGSIGAVGRAGTVHLPQDDLDPQLRKSASAEWGLPSGRS